MLIIKDSKSLDSFVLNKCKLSDKLFDHDFPSIGLVFSSVAMSVNCRLFVHPYGTNQAPQKADYEAALQGSTNPQVRRIWE